jgi:large subunit ribosomal protein L19
VEKVEVERKGSVRRAKLTYLRQRIGKGATLVKEKEGRLVKDKPAAAEQAPELAPQATAAAPEAAAADSKPAAATSTPESAPAESK